jgi:Leucine-rich repeat (LRR) protein
MLVWLLAAGGPPEVDFTSRWISDTDLAPLAQRPDLVKINLAHTKITDVGLEHLKGLRHVRELNLYYAEYITDDGIAHLAGWKELEVLNLRGTRVTSKVLPHLARLTSLRSLDIAFTEVDDEGFELLASLEKLERLAIGGNRLTGSSLPFLKLLPNLRELDAGGIQRVDSGLWGLPLSEENLARLGALTSLRRLNLSGATLNDRGADRPGHPEAERAVLHDIKPLAKLTNLEYLDLSRQPVTAEALAALQALPRLTELRLGLVRNLPPESLASLRDKVKIFLNGTWLP